MSKDQEYPAGVQEPPPGSGRGFAPEEILGLLNESELKNAPARLYIAGRADLLRIEPRVSIVGSRRAGTEGLARARRLARALAEKGVPVVSGLAVGVDTAAHTAAVEAGGTTIAVLPTPLDARPYPPENEQLLREIVEKHLAVSQFAPGSPIRKANFPMRNRTMALISDASVIVEAGETSGSLHQGWEALRLGRLLFIMRSLFDRADLRWPREMLKYGAKVLVEPEDLLSQLELPAGETAAAAQLAF